MKLRLTLKTRTNKGKEISIKFNIAPSKHLGFINFVNNSLKQDESINISLERIAKSGIRDDDIVSGSFKFQEKK
jgi:hypothetical protein